MDLIFGSNSHDWFYKSAYPELDSLPFVKAAVPLSFIVATTYLAFVLKIGPAIMKNRKPLELRNVLLAYNAFQVIFSAYLASMAIRYYIKYGIFHPTCFADDEERRSVVFFRSWIFVVAKATELLDTVFFVLRKKSEQISFLHVYHHTIMLTACWITLKFAPHDAYSSFAMFNGIIHVFMYSYYGFSAIPGLTKYLWWKKYITTLQLIQFVAIFVHFQITIYLAECPPQKFYIWLTTFNNFALIYLFGKFYIDNYIKNGGLNVKKPPLTVHRRSKKKAEKIK